MNVVGWIGCREDELTTLPPAGQTKLKLTDFTSAQVCSSCHPNHYNEWNGSMHHYATNDPIWMNSINSLQASTNGKLKDWCWQCHSPIGFLTGNAPSTFQFSDLEPIVREGVTCDVCHSMLPPHTTTNQTIAYNIKPGRTKYGPLSDAVANMAHESKYEPSFERSEQCRGCHDLISNNIPVEITFTEWQNSAWGAMSVECQNCHMPTYTGRAASGGPIRNNIHRHDFVGVDVAMTDFPNKTEQRNAVDSLLKKSASLFLDTPVNASAGDSVQITVRVHNDKTGHNLPSSVFFNRQMWLEVTVSNGSDTVYRSGYLDANGDLMDKNSALRSNEDKNLMLFGGALFKNGHESNVFEMDSLVNNSIPAFQSRIARYRFKANTIGSYRVKTRLLFRPFGPYLFRSLNANQYISELPIFEMNVQESLVEVR